MAKSRNLSLFDSPEPTSADDHYLEFLNSNSEQSGEQAGSGSPLSGRHASTMEPSWLAALGDEFTQPYMSELSAFLQEEKSQHRIYPKGDDLFSAFWASPIQKVRVVILGQDPYHGPGQAHGLCFSVLPGVPTPPSLVNIFKELKADLGIEPPDHGYLQHWAEQGVFLLNTCLTVRAHEAQSHSKRGWEIFSDRVIQVLNEQRENIIFVLWGRPAQQKSSMIDESRHHILTAPHPSPLSAHRGFFGCQHFSKINAHLRKMGQREIDWVLPPTSI